MKKLLLLVMCFTLLFPAANVYDTHESWECYPSATLNDQETFDIELDYEKLIKQNDEEIRKLLQEKQEYIKLYADKIMEKSGDMAKAYNEVGILYAENYYYDVAIRYFISSLKVKQNWNVYNNVANIHYILGQDNRALKFYKEALKIKKDQPLILLNLSFIYFEKGKFKHAKKNYLKAVTIDPTLDKPEYKILAGEHLNDGTKASNKGVEKIRLKWAK